MYELRSRVNFCWFPINYIKNKDQNAKLKIYGKNWKLF